MPPTQSMAATPAEAEPWLPSLRFRSTRLDALLVEAERGGLADRLFARGLDRAKAALFADAARRLHADGAPPSSEVAAFWVPGRIELLGKHTDYAGGRSLLAAANRGFAVVCTPSGADGTDARRCRILASFALARTRDDTEFELSATLAETARGSWAGYPAAVARRLASNFAAVRRGVHVALECDLAESSGMSSSSAIVCLTFLALAWANDLPSDAKFRALLGSPERLCHYLGCCENGHDHGDDLPGSAGVGTFGGSEDHTAIMCCEADQLRLYSYCPTTLERVVPFPRHLRLVVGVSGATAQKSAEKLHDYNNAALLARWTAVAAMGTDVDAGGGAVDAGAPTLAEVVRAASARLGAPRDADHVRENVAATLRSADDGRQYGPLGPMDADAAPTTPFAAGALGVRFEQFWRESEVIIPRAVDAFERGDVGEFGRLVDASHALTHSHLRNTTAETHWLACAARSLGALAASAFGAGFGGSVWALARADAADGLCATWRDRYAAEFPHRADKCHFFALSPGPGACCI